MPVNGRIVHDAKRPIIAINIIYIFDDERRALYRIKLETRVPFKIIPIKAAIHMNIPTMRTISQFIGVGSLQNKGLSGKRSSSMITE